VRDAKARWIGHALHADVAMAVDGNLTVAAANDIAATLQRALHAHLPALAEAHIRLGLPHGALGQSDLGSRQSAVGL
jgi:divalent metal cation (Fe/Co/Zn/Cd) transporter